MNIGNQKYDYKHYRINHRQCNIRETSRAAVEIKNKDYIIEDLFKFCNGKNDINNIAKEMMKIHSNLSVADIKVIYRN